MRIFLTLIIVLIVLTGAESSSADTVILHGGRKVKGLILEEYDDRIIVSTVNGRESFLKSDIRSVAYDDRVRALMQKADNLFRRRRYVQAYQTYEKAARLSPGRGRATERAKYMRNFLENKTREDIIAGLDRKNRKAGADVPDIRARLTDELGITVSNGEKYAVVTGVVDPGIFHNGVHPEPGDRIVAVWGKRTAYMTAEEVASEMLAAGEVRLTIQRDVSPELSESGMFLSDLSFNAYRKVIGGEIELLPEGLVVSHVDESGPFFSAGIREGDLLWRLGSRDLRFTPLSKVISVFMDKQGERVDLVLRRRVIIWRKEREG
jgi:C-terminal processing protease CtpA/Prc